MKKNSIFLFMLLLLLPGCESVRKNDFSSVKRADVIARDIAFDLFSHRYQDVDSRLFQEISIRGTTGVVLINQNGETILGYIVDANGEILKYRGNFKTLLLSSSEDVDDVLVFYRKTLLGMVRIVTKTGD